MFSTNTDSLDCQPFKGVNWALVLGLPLRDTIKGLLLVPGPILIPTFGLVSWAYAHYFKPHQILLLIFICDYEKKNEM